MCADPTGACVSLSRTAIVMVRVVLAEEHPPPAMTSASKGTIGLNRGNRNMGTAAMYDISGSGVARPSER